MMSLLFPRKCILCRRLLRREELDLCGDCRRNTDPYASGERKFKFLDSMTAVWYYEENVRRSIVRYKFYGARYLAANFGRLIAMRVLQEELEFDLITWVPVSRWQELWAGSWAMARCGACGRSATIRSNPLFGTRRSAGPMCWASTGSRIRSWWPIKRSFC